MYATQPILLSCRIFASPGVEKCVLSSWKQSAFTHCHVLGLCLIIRRVLGWMIGFIDALSIQCVITINYSAIAISTLYSSLLHTLVSSVSFFNWYNKGMESNWVHAAPRPPIGLLCQPRVIMVMEKFVEWSAGETKVLGENLPQCRFVHHKPQMLPGRKPRPPRWEACD
jgi:hypothetical protein